LSNHLIIGLGGTGGGIFIDGSLEADSTTVTSNSGANGGGMNLTRDAIFEKVNILSNSSSQHGGGVYISGSINANLSTFIENNSGDHGGGIWMNGEITLDSTDVNSNQTAQNGSGIYGNGTINMTFTEINDNTAGNDGGGIWWGSGQVTVERSDVRRNSAYRGGGVFILAENPIFQFDVISLNDAVTIGGGMYISKASNVSSTPIIFNTTTVYNTASVLGSGLLCTYQTNPVVQNSIFWGNLAADGVQMHLQGGSEIFVTYSDVAGGESGIVGFDDIIFQNNIDQIPDFVDSEDENYNLLITSPCIDAGNPNAPLDPDGTVPDMGAYYFAQDGIPNIETQVELLEFGGVAIDGEFNMVLPIENYGLADLEITGVVIEPDNFMTTDSSFTVSTLESFDVNLS